MWPQTHTPVLVAWFFKVFISGWKTLRASSGLVDRLGCWVDRLLIQLRGQGSISSGMMVRMTSSLPRLTTVRSVSSRFMAALTSLAEVIRSPLMLMMTSLSCRPALPPRKKSEGKQTSQTNIYLVFAAAASRPEKWNQKWVNPHRPHVKTSDYTGEINMFTAWY